MEKRRVRLASAGTPNAIACQRPRPGRRCSLYRTVQSEDRPADSQAAKSTKTIRRARRRTRRARGGHRTLRWWRRSVDRSRKTAQRLRVAWGRTPVPQMPPLTFSAGPIVAASATVNAKLAPTAWAIPRGTVDRPPASREGTRVPRRSNPPKVIVKKLLTVTP